jgi:hypothetical protein
MFIVFVVVYIGNGVGDGHRAGHGDFDRAAGGGLHDAVIAGQKMVAGFERTGDSRWVTHAPCRSTLRDF